MLNCDFNKVAKRAGSYLFFLWKDIFDGVEAKYLILQSFLNR